MFKNFYLRKKKRQYVFISEKKVFQIHLMKMINFI